LKNNKFTLDSIIKLKWHDPRVVSLVPPGLTEIAISGKAAAAKMWMPEIAVTNRDMKKFDIIATTVIVGTDGSVTKIERATVVCNNIFQLRLYPFDRQTFSMIIASSKYMTDELVLKAEEGSEASGVREGLMHGFPYDLRDWKVYVFEEQDGALKKSRGVLAITVKRTFDKYGESHLMPTVLFLVISWGVFQIPLGNPFVTPRLALSILAMLSFTTLILQSSGALPDGAPCNWNDILNSQVQAMMFATIVLNIFVEICKHEMKLEEFALFINTEAKLMIPATSVVVVGLAMCSGYYKWMLPKTCGTICKVLDALVFGSYMGCNLLRMQTLKKQKDQEAAEKANAAKLVENKV
jgi:hypothetical protein